MTPDEFNPRGWEDLIKGYLGGLGGFGAKGGEPAIDMVERKDELVLIVDLPGVKKEDIELDVTEDGCEISASAPSGQIDGNYIKRERPTDPYHRYVHLDVPVTPERTHASYENGILTIRFEKAKSRGLSVSVA